MTMLVFESKARISMIVKFLALLYIFADAFNPNFQPLRQASLSNKFTSVFPNTLQQTFTHSCLVRMASEDADESLVNQLPLATVPRRSLIISAFSLMVAPLALDRLSQYALAAPLSRVKLGSPILTVSVLLDLLPISGVRADALRVVQSEIEKVTILKTIYNRGKKDERTGDINIPGSVWDQVSIVTTKALNALHEKRAVLEPVFREVDNAEVQIRRAERGEAEFFETREMLQLMKNASEHREIESVLTTQEGALLHLGAIGELLVPEFPFQVTTDEQYDSIPRLLGRALVDLSIRREVSNGNSSVPNGGSLVPISNSTIIGNISLVVDGYSAPVSAGNFIDLCLRGFYNNLPLNFDTLEDINTGNQLKIAIGGTYREGFVDPVSGNVRRVPLEILRSDPKLGNVPFYGAARNTRIFTKSPAVQTFRIPGAFATYHPLKDGNGGSSQFFWLTDDNLDNEGVFMNPSAEFLDGKYSIFAYIINDRLQVQKQLQAVNPGTTFYIDKAVVTYGADNLVKTKAANFKELLLKKGSSNDDDD